MATAFRGADPSGWTGVITRQMLSIILFIITTTVEDVHASAEYSAVGVPKCDPPGKFRAGEKLDFEASKRNGAVVDSKGFSFIRTDQLRDCANWCCLLPAINCSVAVLEIKPSGANCHLQTCFPSELCVFTHGAEFVSYDRTFFVPKEAYNVTAAAENSNPKENSPSLSFVDSFVPSSRNGDPQHDSVIKPRKGVGPPPEIPAERQNNSSNQSTVPNVSSKRKTPVGLIFLYASIILCVLALLAFLGQKFLDCWERRHYTRADYLLDGMYEDKHDLKTNCASY